MFFKINIRLKLVKREVLHSKTELPRNRTLNKKHDCLEYYYFYLSMVTAKKLFYLSRLSVLTVKLKALLSV